MTCLLLCSLAKWESIHGFIIICSSSIHRVQVIPFLKTLPLHAPPLHTAADDEG